MIQKTARHLPALLLCVFYNLRKAVAKGYYEGALVIWNQGRGPAHHVADALYNLGVNARHRGQYAEAQRYYERALEIREGIFGPEHPGVALVLNNLGANARDLGQSAAAQAYFERALAIERE